MTSYPILKWLTTTGGRESCAGWEGCSRLTLFSFNKLWGSWLLSIAPWLLCAPTNDGHNNTNWRALWHDVRGRGHLWFHGRLKKIIEVPWWQEVRGKGHLWFNGRLKHQLKSSMTRCTRKRTPMIPWEIKKDYWGALVTRSTRKRTLMIQWAIKTPIEELYDTMYEEEDTYDSMGD